MDFCGLLHKSEKSETDFPENINAGESQTCRYKAGGGISQACNFVAGNSEQ